MLKLVRLGRGIVRGVGCWLGLGTILRILWCVRRKRKKRRIRRLWRQLKNSRKMEKIIIFMMLTKMNSLILFRKNKWISKRKKPKNIMFLLEIAQQTVFPHLTTLEDHLEQVFEQNLKHNYKISTNK